MTSRWLDCTSLPASFSTSHSSKTTARAHLFGTAQRIVSTKGFASVGLNQILSGIPKGSFYYYFASKEAFGKDLLEHYFATDLKQMDSFLLAPGRTARERLIAYWKFFRANQKGKNPEGRCLAVKLGAEFHDMSEDMKLALKTGTSMIVSRLSHVLKEGRGLTAQFGSSERQARQLRCSISCGWGRV